jgi:hypothetical protein
MQPIRITLRPLCALVALALPGSAALAGDLTFSTSGYGTVGAAYNGDRSADYVPSILSANGAGYNRRVSTDLDTRLGLQFSASKNALSAVLQLVSEQQIDGTYRPQVEWANLKYQVTPDLAVRAGRIALPVFLAADYRKVGYAYPWVRPPVEVYSSVPISHSDGVDLTWRWNQGNLKHVTQLSYGRNNQKSGADSHVEARAIIGLQHTLSWGSETVRLSALTADLTVDLVHEQFLLYRQLGPVGAALADRYDVDHKRTDSFSLGYSHDPGDWFATGEIVRTNTRSYLGDRTAWFVSGGLRRGAFTPYLGYSSVTPNMANSTPGVPLAGLPPPLVPAVAQLNAGLNDILRYIPAQRTVSAGLRWDWSDSIAVKLQHERVTPRGGTYGTFEYIQPGFGGSTRRITSATVDFVF